MNTYESILIVLPKFGFDGRDNVSDFWFKNKDRISPAIYGKNVFDDTFSLQVRWESDLGITCQKEVKNFINTEIEYYLTNRNTLLRDTKDPFQQAKIAFHSTLNFDFKKFTFLFNNKKYSLNDFSDEFDTTKIFGQNDLRFIDLSGIEMRNCNIIDCDFSNSNFTNSFFYHVSLIHTDFVKVNFDNSKLVMCQLDEKSSFRYSSFKNSSIGAITIKNDLNLSHIEYVQVSYFHLLWKSLKYLISPKSIRYFKDDNHTVFHGVDVQQLVALENKETKDYITWYNHVMSKFSWTEIMPFKKRLQLVFSILSTKHWTSYSALAGFALFLNLIFATLIYTNVYSFKGLDKNFLQSFYYSIVTFTTLGYGDISPCNSYGQILVIINAISGYIILGLFVFLVSRKIDKAY